MCTVVGMDERETSTCRCFGYSIGRDRLYAKVNFFLLYSVGAITLPALPVYGVQLGLNPASLTLVLTVVPFIIFVIRPVIGGIADKLQKVSFVVAIVLILEFVGLLALTTIPPVASSSEPDSKFSVNIHPDQGLIMGSVLDSTNASCIRQVLVNSSTHCQLACPCVSQNNTLPIAQNSSCDGHLVLKAWLLPLAPASNASSTILLRMNDSVPVQSSSSMALSSGPVTCNASCSSNLRPCFAEDVTSAITTDVVLSYQLCAYLLVVSLIRVCISSSCSLSDAACFEVLKDRPQDYGLQRMWGTIGWGLMAPISGLVIDIVNSVSGVSDYSPGFYFASALLVLQVLVSAKWNLRTTKCNRNIVKNIGGLLKRPKNFCFLLDIFVVGACSSVHWFYVYYYLQKLGATRLLMGLTLAVQCFLGDLPFMFLSRWLLSKMRHINVIRLAYVGFFLKYLLYSLLGNPWWAIAIELLQGPTYGSFYVAMTSYAQSISPPGTEATFQSVISSVFDCFGVAAGSFLGGMGIAYIGPSKTYLAASFVALGWLFFTVLCHVCISGLTTSEQRQGEGVELKRGSSQPFLEKKPAHSSMET